MIAAGSDTRHAQQLQAAALRALELLLTAFAKAGRRKPKRS